MEYQWRGGKRSCFEFRQIRNNRREEGYGPRRLNGWSTRMLDVARGGGGRQSQRRESGSTPADSTRHARSTRRKMPSLRWVCLASTRLMGPSGSAGSRCRCAAAGVNGYRRSNFRLSVPARVHAQVRSTKRPPDHDLLPEVRTVHGEKISSLGLAPKPIHEGRSHRPG